MNFKTANIKYFWIYFHNFFLNEFHSQNEIFRKLKIPKISFSQNIEIFGEMLLEIIKRFKFKEERNLLEINILGFIFET